MRGVSGDIQYPIFIAGSYSAHVNNIAFLSRKIVFVQKIFATF